MAIRLGDTAPDFTAETTEGTIEGTTGTDARIVGTKRASLATTSETASKTHVKTMGMTHRRGTADKSA